MASYEEIMMTINAKDNASATAKQIDGSFKSMASNIQSAMANMSSGLMNISTGMNNMLGSVTNGKTASDLIFGTSSKAETNKVLLKNMTETAEGAEALYKTVDSVTDKSLTSMQELIPAMNAFKAATGAGDTEMQNITDDMANFGAAVLAQTGSADLAQGAMMDLSKGIKGAFASLDQYGVSEDALMRTGLWSGKEDDVEGYMAAVTEVIGSTEELMQTNEGLDAQLGKSFSRAGKKIGNEFLPFIKDIKKGFIELDNSMGGELAAGILVASQGVDMLSSSLFTASTMITGVKDIGSAIGDISTFAKNASKAIKDMGKATETVSDTMDTASNVSGLMNESGSICSLKGLDPKMLTKEADVVEEVVDDASAIGAVGPKAAVAGAEMEAASVSLSSIATGAMSMLAPLLEISIVVAVMIPIIAGLAAEALLFIKGLQILIDSLNFDDINLDGAINGIKQVATALFEVGVAMGAMTFTNIMTGLAVITSGLFGIFNPIAAAKDLLKKAAKELQELSNLKIDPSIPKNIESITTGLKAVSEAMSNLTKITLDMAVGNLVTLGGALGTISSAMETAKNEIINAANKIAEMNNLPEIDEDAVTKLKSTSDSLKSVSDAMKALQDLNWTTIKGNLFGNTDVIHTLNNVKDDIYKAAEALRQFKDMPALPEDVGKKLKSTADSLKSVSDAIKTLQDLNWTTIKGNLFGNTDVIHTLSTIKDDIWKAAGKLRELADMPAIPEGTGNKIKRVAWTLTDVKNAFDVLGSIGKITVSENFSYIPQQIVKAKETLFQVSAKLRELADISNIPEGTGEKIQRVGWTAANVMNALRTLNSVQSVELNVDSLNTTFASASNVLYQVSAKLRALNDISAIPEGLGEKILRVSWTATSVANAVNALNSVPAVADVSATNITNAVTAVQNAVNELNGLSNATLTEGIGGILTSVQSVLTQLQVTLTSMNTGFYTGGSSIGSSIVNGVKSGLSPLTSTVTAAVTSATGSAASAGWTGGSRIGTSTTNGFKSSLKLANVMTTEMGYVKTAVDNGISAAVSAAQSGAKEVVEAFKNGINVGSPGDIARTMKQEMIYTKDFIIGGITGLKTASYNAARSIVESFGNPSLNLSDSYNNTGFTMDHLLALDTLNSQAPKGNMNNNSTTIIFNEGAMPIDARNMTSYEAKQWLILALESLGVDLPIRDV